MASHPGLGVGVRVGRVQKNTDSGAGPESQVLQGVGAGGGAEGGVCRESLSRALFPSDSDTTGAQARLPQPQCRDLPWDVCCETRPCSEIGWRAVGSDLAASTPRLQPLCARQYSLLSAKKGHSPSVHTDRSTWSDAPTQKAHKFPLLLPGAELSLPGEG